MLNDNSGIGSRSLSRVDYCDRATKYQPGGGTICVDETGGARKLCCSICAYPRNRHLLLRLIRFHFRTPHQPEVSNVCCHLRGNSLSTTTCRDESITSRSLSWQRWLLCQVCLAYDAYHQERIKYPSWIGYFDCAVLARSSRGRARTEK